jgi:hypothetical protein
MAVRNCTVPGPLPRWPTQKQFRETHPPPASPGLGRLCQARFRWSPAGFALSRPLHPPRGHFQSSFVGLRRRPGHLPLEGLRARKQTSRMTLAATEFYAASFCMCFPKASSASGHFGFLANRFRASRLALCRQLLGCSCSMPPEVRSNQAHSDSSSLWHCPRCGATMIVIQRFTAAELSTCTYFDSS